MTIKADGKQTALLQEPLAGLTPLPINYVPIPHPLTVEQPVWRVLLEINTGQSISYVGLDINDEITVGRGSDGADFVDLTAYGAEARGVSRHHIHLRPSPNNLYVLDTGSTNGTLRNDHSIGVNTPYALADKDRLALGHLEMRIRIIKRPYLQTTPLKQKPDLVDALSQIASAVTSQLNLEEVLSRVAATAMSLTTAALAHIWLVNENSGELQLQVELGDVRLSGQTVLLQLASQVIRHGRPLRNQTKPRADQPDLLAQLAVAAIALVPISLGGVTFGVLAVAHTDAGQRFDGRDEQLLRNIADFAAIAIQNARLYQATDQALARRVSELSALNEVSRAVSASLDLHRVYRVLLRQINKHWPVEAVHLYVVDETEKRLRPLHVEQSAKAQLFPLDQGIVGRVASSGQPLISNNITLHPDYDPRIDHVQGAVTQTLACVPLKVKHHVVGLVALFNKKNGLFTDEDLLRLEAFAHPMATAVENARLFEESERQRAAIQATALTLSEPLIVLDHKGTMLVANEAANQLLQTHLSQMFQAISDGVGRTSEVLIGNQTYLATTEHVPDVGTIIIMQNITYVKQLEKDRSEFLHMLSHDLKNPLTSINGWSVMLKRSSELSEKGQMYLQHINTASERMLGMIHKLLYTVTDTKSLQPLRQPCHLTEIVARVRHDVEGAALEKGITLTQQVEGDAYPLLGDKTRLYHMVLNLVDNALKYSPNETTITLIVSYGRDAIQLAVCDEGPGIPAADLPHIFEKHYRGIQEVQQVAAGTGLGLTAVKQIVEAHNGKIAVRNGATVGTVVTVTLPNE